MVVNLKLSWHLKGFSYDILEVARMGSLIVNHVISLCVSYDLLLQGASSLL